MSNQGLLDILFRPGEDIFILIVGIGRSIKLDQVKLSFNTQTEWNPVRLLTYFEVGQMMFHPVEFLPQILFTGEYMFQIFRDGAMLCTGQSVLRLIRVCLGSIHGLVVNL